MTSEERRAEIQARLTATADEMEASARRLTTTRGMAALFEATANKHLVCALETELRTGRRGMGDGEVPAP